MRLHRPPNARMCLSAQSGSAPRSCYWARLMVAADAVRTIVLGQTLLERRRVLGSAVLRSPGCSVGCTEVRAIPVDRRDLPVSSRVRSRWLPLETGAKNTVSRLRRSDGPGVPFRCLVGQARPLLYPTCSVTVVLESSTLRRRRSSRCCRRRGSHAANPLVQASKVANEC